tara:strand:- start:409 stop:948 length:540 start_codon:yes stop_codon:yes gene_type:complete
MENDKWTWEDYFFAHTNKIARIVTRTFLYVDPFRFHLPDDKDHMEFYNKVIGRVQTADYLIDVQKEILNGCGERSRQAYTEAMLRIKRYVYSHGFGSPWCKVERLFEISKHTSSFNAQLRIEPPQLHGFAEEDLIQFMPIEPGYFKYNDDKVIKSMIEGDDKQMDKLFDRLANCCPQKA